jgi:hypothetical protein
MKTRRSLLLIVFMSLPYSPLSNGKPIEGSLGNIQQHNRFKSWLMTMQSINKARYEQNEFQIPPEIVIPIFKQAESLQAEEQKIIVDELNKQLLKNIQAYLILPQAELLGTLMDITKNLLRGADPNAIIPAKNASIYGLILDNAPDFNDTQIKRLNIIMSKLLRSNPDITATDVREKIDELQTQLRSTFEELTPAEEQSSAARSQWLDEQRALKLRIGWLLNLMKQHMKI